MELIPMARSLEELVADIDERMRKNSEDMFFLTGKHSTDIAVLRAQLRTHAEALKTHSEEIRALGRAKGDIMEATRKIVDQATAKLAENDNRMTARQMALWGLVVTVGCTVATIVTNVVLRFLAGH